MQKRSLTVLLLFFSFCGFSQADEATKISWQPGYEPDKCTFFIHNEIQIQAPPERVWAILNDASTK